jgi:MoxR-like ATPase
MPLHHANRLLETAGHIILGKERELRLALACLIARGHLLIEDVPGVGKTTLAQAIARSIQADFQRVQFTSDLLPGDILGVVVYQQDRAEFSLKKGPIFTNVLLADEINRTTPRTQSALLEAMAERRVSIDDQTHPLPASFLVIATQNPLEYHGTYPLPESQLDRFLVRLSIGYADRLIERDLLLQRRAHEPVHDLPPVMTLEQLRALQLAVEDVRLDESLAEWIIRLVEETRRSSALRTGVSTRGALALARAVRAHALVKGRAYVIPDDINRMLVPVLAHRTSLAGASGALGGNRAESEAIIEEIASRVDAPL